MGKNKNDAEDERDIWFILLAVTVGITFFPNSSGRDN